MARPAVMLHQVAKLVPFEHSVPSGLQVSAELIWTRPGELSLSFSVLSATGLADLALPAAVIDGPQQQGQRKHDLWMTTCFEAFLGLPGHTAYWEINLAANGDWNVYSFDDYRSGQQEQPLDQPPTVALRRRHHRLQLETHLDLKPWWPEDIRPDIALTCVLDRRSHGISHWALSHTDDTADFHRRSGFLQP